MFAHALAALLYLALALWALRVVLPDPRHLVPARAPIPGERLAKVDRTDQRFVVGTTIATTRRLLEDPRHFLDGGGCHPLPKPYTLGEHMVGSSLLAAVPYAAWRDPVLAYNAMLGLSWWIAAIAMYALAFFWTRDASAAFVAGLLFGFHPARLGDPGHPYLYANLWAPLLLLFAHRLFARQRWGDAAALAVLGCLQLLESFYRVIGVSLVTLVYGAFLLVRFRVAWRQLWPKLLVVALVVGRFAAALFGPYLETRTRWGVLQGRSPAMLLLVEYRPLGEAWLGWTLLALALVGLADRLRHARPRDGCDPRAVLLAAAVLVAWCSVWGFGIPFTAIGLPSPLLLLGGALPGLDAVRALRYVWFEVVLIASLLAAYGVLFLTSVRQPIVARGVTGLVVAAAALELFAPTIAPTSFRVRPLEAFAIGANDEQRALHARIEDGAVLDLPLRYDLRGALHDMSYYSFLRGYHGRPAAACYNSFTTPVQAEVAALAARLPAPDAADELYALGFRWIVVHGELVAPGELETLAPLFADRSRTEPIASARHLATFHRPWADPAQSYEERLYQLGSPATPAAPR